MQRSIPKEPIIVSFRRWLNDSPERLFPGAEVKIMLDRIDYLENKLEDAYWDVMQASMGDDF